jgi:cell division protein FtsB
MNASKLLATVIALQVLTLAAQLTGNGGPQVLPVAGAQVGDAGAQRTAQLEEQKRTNDKLDQLIDLLKKSELQVKVVNAEDFRDGAAPRK